MDIRARVLSLIEHLGITRTDFEQAVGLPVGHIAEAHDGLGIDNVDLILKAYPYVRRDWLILGRGSMLRPDATLERGGFFNNGDGNNNSSNNVTIGQGGSYFEGSQSGSQAMLDTIRSLSELVIRLEDRIANLYSHIDELYKRDKA